ncbi:hypothetical protein GYMLUDRAFT_35584 [Collybiopsis luxurians FD-317 M1]|nr:hypothetical protein GYMLUDRAFT_35584 [Collybiopsis luxurians FD-317 M1]
MVYIPRFSGLDLGTVILDRDLDPNSSVDEFSALTDVPLFLGYMLSYILSGILIVQVFLYYLSFRKTDPLYMKITVFAVFLVECISAVIATVLVIWSIISKGYLSYSILEPGFQAVAILCGIASSMVHAFYCWRIRVLGGHWAIIVLIMIISLAQCVMVSISGFGRFSGGDILGAGTSSYTDSSLLCINILWLGGSAVCDIIISCTILYLQNRIMKDLGQTSPLTTRVERVMSVAVDTGMITAIGACIELLFYLSLRNSLVHFIMFYTLPKLYANCLMATLNARLTIDGRGFRESTFVAKEVTSSSSFFEGFRNDRTLPASIEIKVQEATLRSRSSFSSILDIKRQSAGSLIHGYPELSFNAAPKKSSILDLKGSEVHYHDAYANALMTEQQAPDYFQHRPQSNAQPQPPSIGFDSNSNSAWTWKPPATTPSVPSSPSTPGTGIPSVKRHTLTTVDFSQSQPSLRSRKSSINTPPTVSRLDTDDSKFEEMKKHLTLPPMLLQSATSPKLLMPWEEPAEAPTQVSSEETTPIPEPAPLPSSADFHSKTDPDPPFKMEPLRAPQATLQPTAY